MKRIGYKVIMIVVLFIGLFISTDAISQNPPSMPGNHGGNGGAGAPIDGGIGILLALGAAYGGRKAYKAWKNRET